ncbi:MAG: glutamine synthetase, partial [Syntrophobacteria bacterium]
IYEMDEAAREREGITSLPGSLFEAYQEMEKSELMRETLGDHIFNKVLANKKIEWDRFRTHVTDYELNQYLPIL